CAREGTVTPFVFNVW
nr:immunoglobulin heavy chain junction region [Macaca mulatta]MOW24560.1 immunoglobulin heavy chain junction region [Macaca mulatta]MOW24840.1 immunoglobulin heavy chain junction region [Macaca mulatta]MOW24879.1 immunoglobulin heavy chain junction region [Macaca mulatta]MOW25085.1 immunoglobulin heavy chain junction region [Macaca mulatta]